MAEAYHYTERGREDIVRTERAKALQAQAERSLEESRRQIRDAELTKELAAAQVQALVLRVADLTALLAHAVSVADEFEASMDPIMLRAKAVVQGLGK